MATSNSKICEGLLNIDLSERFDLHVGSYVKSSLNLRYINSKTSTIGRALRQAIVDLIDHITYKFNEYTGNDGTILGTENRSYHSRQYTFNIKEDNNEFSELNGNDDKINIEISSLAPTVFYQFREDIGISNENFRQSFFKNSLKDFTNPGKSGSLMYKTFDDLFILKTLRQHEARLLLQILNGYHLQFRQRSTIFNRYIGLYLMRLQTSLSTMTIYVVVMANAFTPSLKINEIFDLKGSKIKRKTTGYLSTEKFYKLKDINFMDLYPDGILIPTNIYHKLKMIVANDTKALKNLNITDFSFILGIRHLDMSESQMLDRQQLTGITALLRATNNLAINQTENIVVVVSPSNRENDITSSENSYLKPLEMLNEKIDMNVYYNNDSIAYETLPIPGIINGTNKRVYIYLALIDMLQTFDHFKHIDQTLRKLTDHNRHLEYSVIESNEYEQRFNQFLFENIFIDAADDFPWAITDVSEAVADINNEMTKNKKIKKQKKKHTHKHPHSIEKANSDPVREDHF
ncbi:unnamed protein product [Rotaria sordida]|uniref:PIPK domain-containing protein n=1 Tax=Rotaria sordida TaxID=392033 RepID=A0A818QQ23_9BILA|nr:unnamed protein product [Rotaria sordida]CAF3644625.1 unnamed protein product [Rotaria sordida]